MERFKRIGLFLTGGTPDETAIRFANRITEIAQSDELICVFSATDAGPEIEADTAEAEVRGLLTEHPASVLRFRFHAGAGAEDVLRSARDNDLDLLVLGRPLPTDQLDPGQSFARIARKSPCSVLIVPAGAQPHLARLLVPMDGSRHARLALETAVAIARGSQHATPQVVAQTVFSVGYGYSKTGVTLPEVIATIASNTEAELRKYVTGVDVGGVEFKTICTCSERLADAVHDTAVVNKMDVIVVGSRGLSPSAAVILGSTTERILHRAALPVLIVKEKGETTTLLEALLGD